MSSPAHNPRCSPQDCSQSRWTGLSGTVLQAPPNMGFPP
uniref:Uncharacterized protein n=1 Tax=Anguilla anguilla TaxID=7936 RepID=A0A0E9PUK8_ANGAN